MKILMVDDDPAVLDLFKRVTESLGITDVVSVANGEDAVSEVIRSRHDLITLDINMPGASGLDVLSMIRNMSPHAIIAIISGYIPEDVPPEIASCADVMIAKPIEMPMFVELVSNAGDVLRHMDVIRNLGEVETSVR